MSNNPRQYLIKTTDLTKQSFIHGNVESDLLKTMIWRVQQGAIKRVLGGPLYRKLLADVQAYNNGESPSTAIPAAYDTLLSTYVIPYLIIKVEMMFAAGFGNVKFRNKSLGRGNDDNINSAPPQEGDNMYEELETQATDAYNDLVRFLRFNIENYPEYKEHTLLDPPPEQEKSSAGDQLMFVVGGRKRINYCNPEERGYKDGDN